MSPLADSWFNFGYIYVVARFTDPDGISTSSLSMTVDGLSLSASWAGNLLSALAGGLPDGPHTAEARASDWAGNGPTILTWSFGVDTVRPTVNITTPSRNPTLTGGSVTLAWTGTDVRSGIAGYTVQLDGGPLVGVGTATTYPFPELAPGIHYFQVVATDLAGNFASSSAMGTVPAGTTNTTTPVTVVISDQVPPWAIVLVVINAAEAAAVVWLAVRRRNEASPREKPAT